MILPKQTVTNVHAKARARSLRSSLLLAHPCDMEIEDIAWLMHRIAVREVDIKGCDGRLLRQGERSIISIRASIQEPGKKRFTIAHELGHFDMHAGQNQLEICTDPGALHSYLRDSTEEKEANAFAVEFLLPEDLVKPMCGKLQPNFDSFGKIAEEFQVTFTAAAMRFMDLTSDRCALVFSEDSRISWAKKSFSFDYFLESGQRLDSHSSAIDFFQGRTPPKEMTQVFAKSWFSDAKVNGDAQLYEQSFAMDRYKSVVTLLWLDQDIEHEDPPERTGRDDRYQKDDQPDYDD